MGHLAVTQKSDAEEYAGRPDAGTLRQCNTLQAVYGAKCWPAEQLQCQGGSATLATAEHGGGAILGGICGRHRHEPPLRRLHVPAGSALGCQGISAPSAARQSLQPSAARVISAPSAVCTLHMLQCQLTPHPPLAPCHVRAALATCHHSHPCCRCWCTTTCWA